MAPGAASGPSAASSSAMAGPSGTSRPETASNHTCSFREIYDHLEGARARLSASELQSLLRHRLPKLRAASQAFPAASEASKAKVKSGTVKLDDGTLLKADALHQHLCDRISETHDLDHVEALLLLKSFLDSEEGSLDILTASGSQASGESSRATKLQKLGGAGGSSSGRADVVNDFLDAFLLFYFEERLYVLRCICSLLLIADDEGHELSLLARTILGDGLADSALAVRCLEQVEASTREMLPEAVRATPRYAAYWSSQRLKEQLALLEVVFLLQYGRLRPTAALITRTLEAIQATDFGRRQAVGGYLGSEAGELLDCVGHMLVLVAIEGLEIEALLEGLNLPGRAGEKVAESERSLVDSPRHIGSAIDFLEATERDPLRSPLLLGWSLLLNRLEGALDSWHLKRPGEQLPSLLKSLEEEITPAGGPSTSSIWIVIANGALAPQMQLFSTLQALAESPLVAPSSLSLALMVPPMAAVAHRAILKSLVLGVTELVRPEFLPDLPGLVAVWESLFGDARLAADPVQSERVAVLCTQFWDADFQHASRSALVITASRRWPVSFRPLTRLLRALSGASGVRPSPDASAGAPPSALGAATSVFHYFKALTTVTQLLPPSLSGVNAPFEIVESTEGPSGYLHRATRDIPFFGASKIQRGTTGSVVSEEGKNVVLLWRLAIPISGWRVARDVLAAAVGALAGSSRPSSGDDNVLDEPSPAANDVALLAADEDPATLSAVIGDILGLFVAVMASGRELCNDLLEHLQTDAEAADIPGYDAGQDLVALTLRVLDQALGGQVIDGDVVKSAYELLLLLAPLRSAELWLGLRSSNVLTGSSGLARQGAPSSRGLAAELDAGTIPSSKMLATAAASADYSSVLALLDLTQGLVLEAQRSHYATPPDLLRIKVDTLLRSLAWILESVFMEYQTWRYARLSDQLDIGIKCTRIWTTLLSDYSLDAAEPAALPLRELSVAVERALVTGATILHLSPLVAVLGSGQQLVEGLRRNLQVIEAERAEELVRANLDLAVAIVARRQHAQNRGRFPRGAMCLLETLFFDKASVGARQIGIASIRSKHVRSELAEAVLRLVLLPDSAAVNDAAVAVVMLLCQSTLELAGDGAEGPNLAAHLGSPDQLLNSFASLVNLVENPYQPSGSRARVWAMLAALVESQPSLATMLLTGRQLHADVEASLAKIGGDAAVEKGLADQTPLFSGRTALEAATTCVEAWKELWKDNPVLLEAILRFLQASWRHASQHPATFAGMRQDEALWKRLRDIATAVVEDEPAAPSDFVFLEGKAHTSEHAVCVDYCSRIFCRVRALELMAADLRTSSPDGTNSSTKRAPTASATEVAKLLSDQTNLSRAVTSAVTITCEPELHEDVQTRFAAAFPSMPLAHLQSSVQRGVAVPGLPYGDSYFYDTDLLARKLQGFLSAPQDSVTDEGLDAVVEMDDVALEQAFLLIASLNLDWSLLDVQLTNLQAWVQLLEASQGKLVNVANANARAAQVQESCLQAFLAGAALATQERRQGGLMVDVHRHRLSLLAILLETAWASTFSRKGETVGSAQDVDKAMEQARRLLTHEVFSVEASLKGTVRPAFHRDALRIVVFALRRNRQLLATSPPVASREMTPAASLRASFRGDRSVSVGARVPSLHRSLHLTIDALAAASVSAFRCAVDNANAALIARKGSSPELDAAQDDIILGGTVLNLLSQQDVTLLPHFWSIQLEQTALLPAANSLLSRVPVSTSTEHIALSAAHHRPGLAHAVLSIFFGLASQPGIAEQLVFSGVMTALCSNALTASLEVGNLKPTMANGSPSAAHACWVLMLKTLSSLTTYIGCDVAGTGAHHLPASSAAGRFVETEVTGFVQLYGAQITAALEFRPLDAPRPGSAVQATSISIERVGELVAVLELFLAMARATAASSPQSTEASGTAAHTRALLTAFATQATSVLQQTVYLLQHPKELSSLVTGSDRMDDDDVKPASKGDSAAKQVQAQLEDVASLTIAALWEWSHAAKVLSADEMDWPGLETILISPTIRTSPSSPTSVGTLLDLSTYFSDKLRPSSTSAGSGNESEARFAWGAVVEQSLALAASQLALCLAGETSENTALNAVSGLSVAGGGATGSAGRARAARVELESGLLRDVLAAIANAKSCVPTSEDVERLEQDAAGMGKGAGTPGKKTGEQRQEQGQGQEEFLDVLADFAQTRLV